MRLGIDASTQLELDEAHPHYFYHGHEIEPWSFMHAHNGCDIMRLRVWNDPYDEEGRPYGGGTSSLERFIVLAKRALNCGYSLLMDFHYSDFWADPGKQNLPKAWRGLNYEETVAALHDFTHDCLKRVKEEGIPLEAVQIGNEITNGICWPHGKLNGGGEGKIREGYDRLSGLLQAGVKAVREVYPEAKVVLHLEKSGAVETHDEWYTQISKQGVDFDIIGLSYYPYWHGRLDRLEENIVNLSAKFHKPIWIVEAGYPFTDEPYDPEEAKKLFVSHADNEKQYISYEGDPLPYPYTAKGQKDYFEFLMGLLRRLNVEVLFYWEPFWVPSTHVGWAKAPGMRYEGQEVTREDLNEWANQCLFDYSGETTPAFDVFVK